ncbi:MAG: hypothetical protein L6Q33_03410 [Bacteriovoracaceae bacterium]|nr:hypothetical protein [Bacteriovoracaceae bacterium]
MMKRKWIFLFSLVSLLLASSYSVSASYSYYEEEDTTENDVYSPQEDDAYINENLNNNSDTNLATSEEIANRMNDEKTKLLELSENISVAIPLETESELEAMNVTREPAVLDPMNDQTSNQNDEQEQSLFDEEETDSVQLGSSAILKTRTQEETEQTAPTYQKRRQRNR